MGKSAFLIEMGKRIARLRNAKEYTQADLADHTNLSQQTISAAERGAKALRPENLVLVSKALDVSVDYLLTGEITNKDNWYLYEKIQALPPEKAEEIEKIVIRCIHLCDK